MTTSELPLVRLPDVRTRVLLVDDDPIQRRLTRIQLANAGFAVDVAAGVEEALRRATEDPPHAILSDVLMGDADGFELCRAVRAHPRLRSVPVVLASAHFREEGDRVLARKLGANALVTRTPTFHAEIEALRAALSAGAPLRTVPSDPALRQEHLRRTTRQLSSLAARATFSEKLYRSLLANARDAIALTDSEGYILEANHRCEEMFGVEPHGLAGRHVSEFAPPGQERSTLAIDEGGVPTPVVLRRPDGGRVLVEWSTTPLEIDGLVFSVGRDVTEQAQAAEALRRSEERYRSLLERIPDVVWSCAADGRVDFVSANYEATCGFTADERCADPTIWYSRIHPEDRTRVLDAFSAFLIGDTAFDVEYRWQHRDGRWLRLHDRSSARYVKDGLVRADGMFSDVTRQRELEDELRQSQKLEALGQLAGGVAHDFNNILSVILANASILASEMAPTDHGREELDEITQAAQRAATLTRQLLSFCRKDVVRPEIVAVDCAITDLAKMLDRLIGEDIQLAIDLRAPGAGVKMDRGQLEQVVLNLAVNARDAMPLGGALAIATSSVTLEDAVAGLPAGRYVAIEVRDHGTGVAPELLPRIFEPFFTTKEPGKGTGLGLSTVYGIVRSAAGAVDVRTELGAGTTFTVFLPERHGETLPPSREMPVAPHGTERVLVVEDDELVRHVVKRILAGAGYRVLEARHAASAASLLSDPATEVDLVLADVVLPETSGPAMMEELRRARPALKALYVSGYANHAAWNARPALDAAFLQKPFSAETLLAKVRAALG